MDELRKTNHVFPRVDWDFEDISFENGFIMELAVTVGLVEDSIRLVGNTFYLSLRKH